MIAATPAILLVAAILAAWEVYARYSGIKATTLPAPSRVLEQAWINRDALFDNTIPTLYATLLGFACSLTTAFLFSILVDFFAPLRRALFPVLIISQTLPLVAIAPLVVLWFGFGLAPAIVETLYEKLIELHREGLTLLLAEQSVPLALEIASYAYVLQTGRTVLEGTARALEHDPQVQRIYLGVAGQESAAPPAG